MRRFNIAKLNKSNNWKDLGPSHDPELRSREYRVWHNEDTGETREQISRPETDSVKEVVDKKTKPRGDQFWDLVDEQYIFDEILSSKPVKMEDSNSNSINKVYFCFNEKGNGFVFKPKEESFNGSVYGHVALDPEFLPAEREALAYGFDQLFGLDIVPPTKIAEIDGKVGSSQLMVTGSTLQRANRAKVEHLAKTNKKVYKKLSRMAIFDIITGNVDRHLGNIMFDEKRNDIFAIDNGASFTRLPIESGVGARRAQDIVMGVSLEWDEDTLDLFEKVDKERFKQFFRQAKRPNEGNAAWETLCTLLRGAGRLQDKDEMYDVLGLEGTKMDDMKIWPKTVRGHDDKTDVILKKGRLNDNGKREDVTKGVDDFSLSMIKRVSVPYIKQIMDVGVEKTSDDHRAILTQAARQAKKYLVTEFTKRNMKEKADNINKIKDETFSELFRFYFEDYTGILNRNIGFEEMSFHNR